MKEFRRLDSLRLQPIAEEEFTRSNNKFKTDIPKIPYKLGVISENEPSFKNTYESPLQRTDTRQVEADEIIEMKRMNSLRSKTIKANSKKIQVSAEDTKIVVTNEAGSVVDSYDKNPYAKQVVQQEEEIKKLRDTIKEKDMMLEKLIKQIETDVKQKSKITHKEQQSSFNDSISLSPISDKHSPAVSPKNRLRFIHKKRSSDSFMIAPSLNNVVNTKDLSLFKMERNLKKVPRSIYLRGFKRNFDLS